MEDGGKEMKGDKSKVIKIVTLQKFEIIMQPRVMGTFFLQEITSAFWENLLGNQELRNIIPYTCISDSPSHPLHIHFEWFGSAARSQ